MRLEKTFYPILTIALCIVVWFSTSSFDHSTEDTRPPNDQIITAHDTQMKLIEAMDRVEKMEGEIQLMTEAVTSRRAVSDLDVSRRSGVTPEQINKRISHTQLRGLGEAIIEAEKIYSVNAIFILSVAQLESAHGSSAIATHKNNLFGMNSWGSTGQEIFDNSFTYETKADSIYDFARRIREFYIDKGRDTVKSISLIYCELPEHWYNKITVLMEQNNKKIREE